VHRRSAFTPHLIETIQLGLREPRPSAELAKQHITSLRRIGTGEDDVAPAPLALARIVNSSKLTARRAVWR
jgi:hypothetical protein